MVMVLFMGNSQIKNIYSKVCTAATAVFTTLADMHRPGL